MRKIILSIVAWFFLVSISFADSGTIYLPIIKKGCDMSNAILEITDGTVAGTIDLLQPGVTIGVNEWTPQSPPILPTMQTSPLTSGSEVSSYKFGNATETIDFKAGGKDSGNDQNSVIEMVQDFRRLLISGVNYQVVDWHNSIVYIRARAKCEDNIRYAPIITFSLPQDDFPFGQPFFGNDVMNNMSVIIERDDWLGAVPGVGESLPMSNQALNVFGSGQWLLGGWELYDSLGAVPDLPAPSAAYIPVAIGNAKVVVAPTDAGAADDMYISADQAATWAAVTNGANMQFYDALKISDSNILFSEVSNGGRILQSTDEGSTVNVLSTDVGGGPIIQLTNGALISSDSDDIYQSIDGGANWSIIGAIGTGTVKSLRQSPTTETIIANVNISTAGTRDQLYRSIDLGLTWSLVYSSTTSYLNGSTETGSQMTSVDEDGIFYQMVHSGTFNFLQSGDDGQNWQEFSNLANLAYSSFVDSNNYLFINYDTGGGGNTIVNRSVNQGSTFVQPFSTSDEFKPYFMSESNDGDYYIGGANIGGGSGGLIIFINDVVEIVSNSTETIGTTTLGRLDIANKYNIAQLSHIFVDDGGVFGSNQFPVTAAFDMYPAVPAVNDAIYFGINSLLVDSGPFCSLRFDIESPLTTVGAGANVAIAWEYWNGAWVALTVTDNTAISDAFDTIGINSVHWVQPSDWATTAVNGVTGFWVRARITAIGGTITPPTHAVADLFTITLPFMFVDSDDIGGDIPALARIKLFNLSDNDGKGGDAPNLWSNRVFLGLRSASRDNDEFTAFINIADEQNLSGITVTAGTNAAFGADTTTPTGRRLTYSAVAGDTTFVDRATITFDPEKVRNFYGKFHVFVRAKDHTASSGEITMRIQLRTGSGGITFTSNEQIFLGNNDWELLDFDAITIPAGGRTIVPDELGDEGVIAIQVKNDSGGSETVYIYDLVLMPTDEWAGDFTDLANIDDSIIGKQDDIQHFLDVDSVGNPKVLGRSLVRLDDANESISANYEFSANGEVILQANADQRVWVLSAHYGSNDEWLSEPWVCWSALAFKNQRYSTQRGSR